MVAASRRQTPPPVALAPRGTQPRATCADTSIPTRRGRLRPRPLPGPAADADRDPGFEVQVGRLTQVCNLSHSGPVRDTCVHHSLPGEREGENPPPNAPIRARGGEHAERNGPDPESADTIVTVAEPCACSPHSETPTTLAIGASVNLSRRVNSQRHLAAPRAGRFPDRSPPSRARRLAAKKPLINGLAGPSSVGSSDLHASRLRASPWRQGDSGWTPWRRHVTIPTRKP